MLLLNYILTGSLLYLLENVFQIYRMSRHDNAIYLVQKVYNWVVLLCSLDPKNYKKYQIS